MQDRTFDLQFDDIASLAAQICDTPLATITLLNDTRFWYYLAPGLRLPVTFPTISFQTQIFLREDVFIVQDIMEEPQLQPIANELIETGIHFFAGIALRNRRGAPIGIFCLMDKRKKLLNGNQYDGFKAIANQVALNLMLFDELKLNTGDTENVSASSFPISMEQVGVDFVKDTVVTETSLRHEKELSDSIINNLPGVFYMYDEDGHFIRWNKNFESVTGYSANEINQMHPLDFYDTDEKPNIKKRIETVFQKQVPGIEALIFTKDRKKIPYYFNSWAVYYQGKPCITGIGIDMTELKKAEREANLKEIAISKSIGGMGITDMSGKLIYANEALWKMWGCESSADIIGKMLPDFFYGKRIYQTIEALQSKGYDQGEDVGIRMDGSLFDIAFAANVIFDDQGAPVCMFGSFVDVTQTKRAQEAFQKTRDNLRTVFDNTEVGYVLCNAKLEVMSFNQPAQYFTQREYNKEIKEGTNMLDYFPAERQSFLKELLEKVYNGTTVEYDRSYIKDNGEEHWYHIKFSPVLVESKNTDGFIMAMENITERKKNEIELSRSFNLVSEQNKRLVNFSYIVSHNLRSHTSNIKSILSILDDSDSEEERNEMLRHLQAVSNSLDETLYHLNEIVSIQKNINITIEPLSITEYFNKATELLAEQISMKNVLIVNSIASDTIVFYNPAYLESILLNFLSNAIKYSHPERRPVVNLSWQNQKGQSLLIIEDNGIGIDLNRFGDKLFGMYKTFHGNSDARGLGLFISKNQIEAMGGRVEVESQVNVGTTFKIYFL